MLTLLGVGMAVFRRAFARPKRLDLTTDAWIILFLIAFLMVTDLVAEAARTALDPSPARSGCRPSASLARLAGGSRRGRASGRSTSGAGGGTSLDILIFGNYLPYSKHFHIITSIPNIFFMNLEPMGQLRDGRPRELRALRRLAGRGPDLEVDARRLHLHRVRALPRRVPDRPDGKAARPEDLHRRRARRGVRGHAFDPRREADGRGNGAAPPAAPGPHRGLDLRGHDLGLHDVRRLHDGVPGLHHPGRRQDRRDAPLSRARQGRVPEGGPERLPRHGDQRQPVEHVGRDRANWAKACRSRR